MSERVHIPKFTLVITLLTGLIATALGVWGWISPESHPQATLSGGTVKVVLSWSARELGQGLACLVAVAFVRRPHVVAVVLFSAWVREVLDFIDFFRVDDVPLRLYIVVGTSVVMHSLGLELLLQRIRKAKR